MTLECPLITTHHHKHDKILITDEVSQQLSLAHLTSWPDCGTAGTHFYLWLYVCFRSAPTASMTVQSVAMCQEHSRQSQKNVWNYLNVRWLSPKSQLSLTRLAITGQGHDIIDITSAVCTRNSLFATVVCNIYMQLDDLPRLMTT